jgi:hypothetical protein
MICPRCSQVSSLGGVFIIGREEESGALVYWELKVEEHRGGEEDTS